MVLEWLSRLLSGFSFHLGGFNSRSVWSKGRGSLSENIFQNSQLEKFTPQYQEYQYSKINVENINNIISMVSQRTHAEEAIRRINLQRDVNLNFIESELQTLKSITIPTPQFISYERVGKKILPSEIYQKPFSYGSGGGVRRWTFRNPERFNIYQKQVADFTAYKNEAISTINAQVEKLTQRRDLITSKAPFSL